MKINLPGEDAFEDAAVIALMFLGVACVLAMIIAIATANITTFFWIAGTLSIAAVVTVVIAFVIEGKMKKEEDQ